MSKLSEIKETQKLLKQKKYECLICLGIVKAQQPIHSCSQCFKILHLSCKTKWSLTNPKCPNCQLEDLNSIYYCFCKKTINPPVFWSNNHSCGNTCFRPLECGHFCQIQCHPLQCPECQVVQEKSCLCQKSKAFVKCSIEFKCQDQCHVLLDCQEHRCELGCHSSETEHICTRMVEVKCICGKSTKLLKCGSSNYQCDEECGEYYECGLHQCTENCHLHESTICPFTPIPEERCPCGKHTIESLLGHQRSSCGEPIPICEEICGKLLLCGHSCSQQCHLGECGLCEVKITEKCQCGDSTVVLPCFATLEEPEASDLNAVHSVKRKIRCEKLCDKRMKCKKHRCSKKCCIDSFHYCDQACQKLLECKKHYCLMDCSHPGKCHPCVQGATFDELVCHCGRTRRFPPIECGGTITCTHPCKRTSPCGHTLSMHYCHSDNVACPQCTAFVTRRCGCGRVEMKNVMCFRTLPPSCGSFCGKTMDCGHICARVCHPGDCRTETNPCLSKCGKTKSCSHSCTRQCHSGDCESVPCSSKCGKTRTCGHLCLYACHGPEGCSEFLICKQVVYDTCGCGLRKEKEICGSTADNVTARKVLECTAECSKDKRLHDMAEALQITPTEKQPWSEQLLEHCLSHMNTLKNIEKQLLELNRKGIKYHYFPSFKKEINKFICEVSEAYGLQADIIDQRSERPSVVIRGTGDMSKLLSQAAALYKRGEYVVEKEQVIPLVARIEYNGLYLWGIPLDFGADKFGDPIVGLLKDGESCDFYWMDDDEGFLVFGLLEDKEGEKEKALEEVIDDLEIVDVPSDEIQEVNEIPSGLVEGTTGIIEKPDDEDWTVVGSKTTAVEIEIKPNRLDLITQALLTSECASKVEKCSVSPLGGIKFENGTSSNFKKRNAGSVRYKDHGWVLSGTWKQHGIKVKGNKV